jgi:hypothetical protein
VNRKDTVPRDPGFIQTIIASGLLVQEHDGPEKRLLVGQLLKNAIARVIAHGDRVRCRGRNLDRVKIRTQEGFNPTDVRVGRKKHDACRFGYLFYQAEKDLVLHRGCFVVLDDDKIVETMVDAVVGEGCHNFNGLWKNTSLGSLGDRTGVGNDKHGSERVWLLMDETENIMGHTAVCIAVNDNNAVVRLEEIRSFKKP